MISSHGLITTVAYKIGESDPIYALEGSVTISDVTTEWLKDNLWIMDIFKHENENNSTWTELVANLNKIHMVPDLPEVYAQFWKTDANGLVPVILCQ